MRKRSQLLLVVLAATVVVVFTSTASAVRLRIDPSTFAATWASMRMQGAHGEIACPVTLEGTLHSATIRKVFDALVGHITRFRIAEASCTATAPVTGSASPLFVPPVRITYQGFTGTLPRISSVRLAIFGFQLLILTQGAIESASCLYSSTGRPLVLRANTNTTTGRLENLQVEEASRIPRITGPFNCPPENALGGTTNFVGPTLGSTSTITVRLI